MNNFLKRSFDLCFSILCLLFLAPIFLVICIIIKLESKGPAIFKQLRVGRDLQPFYIYKFRSMVVHNFSPEELGPVKHDHRLVTRFGYLLRRFKLDELPQFINVLLGNMSVVGPRPCLFSTGNALSEKQKRRFEVLPGLTGWAEINGNVELTWDEQLSLDLWYIDHRGFMLDLKVVFITVMTILFGSVKNEQALQKAAIYLLNNNKKSKIYP